MNKKLTIASALLAASTAFAGLADGVFDLWLGTDGSPQVMTGLDNGTETAGYWFSYDDSGDKGASKVVWGGTVGNEYSETALDGVVLECGGVCGDAVLAKGELTYNPFVGIGFNIVGETSKTDPTPVPGNASSWGGVCITYTSDAAPSLELGLGDEVDQSIGYANPAAALPKSAIGTVKILSWSDFKQPSWYKGDTKIAGDAASKQLVALKFKIQSTPGTYHFNICAIGPSTASCPTTCSYSCCSTKPARGESAAKFSLAGRTLSFSGMNAGTVEILDLQGQVVAKGDVSFALSLANLDAGVYMVRVVGKSANFVDKIVLK